MHRDQLWSCTPVDAAPPSLQEQPQTARNEPNTDMGYLISAGHFAALLCVVADVLHEMKHGVVNALHIIENVPQKEQLAEKIPSLQF